MKKEFLERLGVRRYAVVGVLLGFVVAAAWFYRSYSVRESLVLPLYLYGLLALVSWTVIALFVTIFLTLVSWFWLGRKSR